MKNGAAVSDGTDIYIMSGLSSTNAPTGEVRRYNVAADTYTSLTGFTVANATWNHSAAYLNGKIYKVGGNISSGNSGTRVDVYTIATNTWTAAQSLFATTSFMQVFTDGTYVYAAGGRFDSTNNANDTPRPNAYRLNPANNIWNDSTMPDLPEPRWGAAVANIDGNVLLIGGFVGTSAASPAATSVLSWDPVRNEWLSVYPSLPNARALGAFGPMGSAFNVAGGSATTEADTAGTTTNQKLVCGLLAAGVTVSGRVVTADGRAIRGAKITLTGPDGLPRSAATTGRGTFTFEDVEPGRTYLLQASSRRYLFAAQIIEVRDTLTDLTLTAEPLE